MVDSLIEWTDRSDWNPIRGCTRVSPGCGGPGPHGGCYAEAIAARFSAPGLAFHGFAKRMPNGEPRWTGKVELLEDRLALPLTWRKPAKIFACSMSDLFHESLPDEAIDKVFAIMALARQHTFQLLTKRADRMRSYFAGKASARVRDICYRPERYFGSVNDPTMSKRGSRVAKWPDRFPGWPLPNLWLGVSAEDQQRADERIPDLLATPAAVRFVSAEPLLGPIDFTRIPMPQDDARFSSALIGNEIAGILGNCIGWIPPLDWIIVGGESGRRARAMDLAWARSIVEQCRAAGAACFVKQLGSATGFNLHSSKGGDPAEWAADLRIRQMPEVHR